MLIHIERGPLCLPLNQPNVASFVTVWFISPNFGRELNVSQPASALDLRNPAALAPP